MATGKKTPRKSAKKTSGKGTRKSPGEATDGHSESPPEDVYVLQGDDDDDDETQEPVPPTTIETDVLVDAIEYVEDESDPKAEPTYRVTFHATLPEHIAQHLFAQHVQEGRITVEFQPADPALRRRDALVRR